MTSLTWLHLSDWHEGAEKKLKGQDRLDRIGEQFNRDKVRRRLIEDIREQRKKTDLEHIDFIVFSGDVAFSGDKEEYDRAEELFKQVFEATGIDPQEKSNRLFIVPGNHDLDRNKLGLLAHDIPERFHNSTNVASIQDKEEYCESLLKPFAEYKTFAEKLTQISSSDYASKKVINCESSGKKVILLGFNSALMAGREIKEEINDYGNLIVGEHQILKLLDELEPKKQAEENEVRIAVLHHPFEWLAEFERSSVRNLLIENCHFILCGHQHDPEIYQIQGLEGEYVIIPAGASYENVRYPNSYNFVHLDFANQTGKIYLRRWSGEKWIRDDLTYREGEYTFSLPTKKGQLRQVSRDQLIKKYEELSDWKEQHQQWQAICTEVISLRTGLPAYQTVPSDKFWEFREHWNNCKTLVAKLLPKFERFSYERISCEKYILSGLARKLVSTVHNIAESMSAINNDYKEMIEKIAREHKKTIDKHVNQIESSEPERNSNILEDQDREQRKSIHQNKSEKYIAKDINSSIAKIMKPLAESRKILENLEEQDKKIQRHESSFDILADESICITLDRESKTTIEQDDLQKLAKEVNDILQSIDNELQKSITTFEKSLKGEANVQ